MRMCCKARSLCLSRHATRKKSDLLIWEFICSECGASSEVGGSQLGGSEIGAGAAIHPSARAGLSIWKRARVAGGGGQVLHDASRQQQCGELERLNEEWVDFTKLFDEF
jgi:hypothetical protein